MTTVELKKVLIHRIAEINDVSFLKAIKTILDSKTDTEVIALTPEQRFEIMESKKEVEPSILTYKYAEIKSAKEVITFKK